MLSREPIGSLKGIGEKTAKLYEKLGIFTVGDLISYYPRSYEIYGLPVPIGSLKEDTVWAVSSILTKAPDLVRFNRMQMVSAHIKDLTGSLRRQLGGGPALYRPTICGGFAGIDRRRAEALAAPPGRRYNRARYMGAERSDTGWTSMWEMCWR